MTDDTATDTPRRRPLPLGRFVLTRTGRLAGAGGRRLARDVVGRHDGERLAGPPRLAYAGQSALARSAAPGDPSASPPAPEPVDEAALGAEAERLASISGYSRESMEYLLANGPSPGSGATMLGEGPVAAQRTSRSRAVARSASPRRTAIEEGAARPRRLSRKPLPAGAGEVPAGTSDASRVPPVSHADAAGASPSHADAAADASVHEVVSGSRPTLSRAPAQPEPAAGTEHAEKAANPDGGKADLGAGRSDVDEAKADVEAVMPAAAPRTQRVALQLKLPPQSDAPGRPVVQRVESRRPRGPLSENGEAPAAPEPAPPLARRIWRTVVDALVGARPEAEVAQSRSPAPSAQRADGVPVAVMRAPSAGAATAESIAAPGDAARLGGEVVPAAPSPATERAPGRLARSLLRLSDATPARVPARAQTTSVGSAAPAAAQRDGAHEPAAPAPGAVAEAVEAAAPAASPAAPAASHAAPAASHAAPAALAPRRLLRRLRLQTGSTAVPPPPKASARTAAGLEVEHAAEPPASTAAALSRAPKAPSTDPPPTAPEPRSPLRIARAQRGGEAPPLARAQRGGEALPLARAIGAVRGGEAHAQAETGGGGLHVAAPTRPRLRLMRSDDDTGTAGPPARAAARTSAQTLARATSGAIEYEEDGRVSVLFPPPGAVLASPGTTVAREASEIASMPAQSLSPAPVLPATSSAVNAQPAGSSPIAPSADGVLDRDELYADFVRRLRRDVLEEREQLGEL